MIARLPGTRLAGVLLFLLATGLSACTTPAAVGPPPPPPDYSRPLPPGASALRLVTDAGDRPDLGALANQFADPGFAESLGRSVAWYNIASSQRTFPISGISHVHAKTSAQALLWIVNNTDDPRAAARPRDTAPRIGVDTAPDRPHHHDGARSRSGLRRHPQGEAVQPVQHQGATGAARGQDIRHATSLHWRR